MKLPEKSSHSLIARLGPDERVEGCYRFQSLARRCNADGFEVWHVRLADRSGVIDTYRPCDGGDIVYRPDTDALVHVAFRTRLFKDRLVADLLEFDFMDVVADPACALDRLPRPLAQSPEVLDLVDLHRIALTYVTNKKGGDQIMAAEMEETRKRHLYDGIPLDGFDTRLITGSVDQGEIQEVVRRAQDRVKEGEEIPSLSGALRSVIATSAISHGVDVDELNSMWFAGMPSDIAEYIQASSRVGRTHVGFVVLIPTPQRRRDRFIVSCFDSFHRFLERMVMPAAIDRWAEKAVRRVIPSLIQAYLVGVVPSKEIVDLPEADKVKAHDFSYIPNIKQEIRTRSLAFISEVVGFIELAIGLKAGYCPQGEEHYRKLIEEEVRYHIKAWSTDLRGEGPLNAYFRNMPDAMRRPMTSLRDVDESGVIVMSPRDSHNRKMKAADVVKIMGLVRNGVAQNDGGNDNEVGSGG